MSLQDTLQKFGYPESLIKPFQHWYLLLRPQQTTLAAMILICREEATSYADISSQALAEQGKIVRQIEAVLDKRFSNDKINYLMLMMVDPEVHFHCIPRYGSTKAWYGTDHIDTGWPALPDLADELDLSVEARHALLSQLKLDFDTV